jgi:hypothetical protein
MLPTLPAWDAAATIRVPRNTAAAQSGARMKEDMLLRRKKSMKKNKRESLLSLVYVVTSVTSVTRVTTVTRVTGALPSTL